MKQVTSTKNLAPGGPGGPGSPGEPGGPLLPWDPLAPGAPVTPIDPHSPYREREESKACSEAARLILVCLILNCACAQPEIYLLSQQNLGLNGRTRHNTHDNR